MQEQPEPLRPTRREETHGELNLGTRSDESHKKTKVDCSRFKSGDPTEWLYKVNKYFEYHKIAEENKLSLVALHLDGAASSWFQWMETNHQVRSGGDFIFQIHVRFGPSSSL